MRVALLDIYSILHSDFHSKAKEDVVSLAPVSGVKLLVRKVASLLQRGYVVSCFFDSKTDRKLIMPEYKKGRPKNPSVRLQAEIALKIFESIGIDCFKVDGYEADDLIYSYCSQLNADIEECMIHTSDKDLANCIVDMRFIVEPVNQQSNYITYTNFGTVLGSSNYAVPVNLITYCKLLLGDASDNIGPYKGADGTKGLDIYLKTLDFIKEHNLYDPYVLRSIQFTGAMKQLGILPDNEDINNRIKIFYPKEYPINIDELYNGSFDNFSRHRFVAICKVLKEYSAISIFDSKFTKPIPADETFREELFTLGKAFANGEFHADRDLNIVAPQGTLLDYTSMFTREL